MPSVSSLYSPLDAAPTDLPPPATADVKSAGDMGVGWSGGGVGDTVFLMAVASLGVTLNALVAASLLTMPAAGHRRSAASFVVHASLLDGVKCAYCVPFAVTAIQRVDTSVCDALSRSYVVLVTASAFNLIALICSESYVYNRSTSDLEVDGRPAATSSPSSSAAAAAEGSGSRVGCTLFGVLMVDACSLLIHLGPTIIGGGDFYHRATVITGPCMPVHGAVKNYVAHAMWIVIMTFATLIAMSYLIHFERHVRSDAAHQFVVAVTADRSSASRRMRRLRRVVRRTLTRIHALAVVSVVFIVSWYPLHVLTIVDPGFRQPFKVYKLLTFLAWSNAAVSPLSLLLFYDVLPQCCNHRQHRPLADTITRADGGCRGPYMTETSLNCSVHADVHSVRCQLRAQTF